MDRSEADITRMLAGLESGEARAEDLLLSILVYSVALSVLAGWLTATIARTKPTRHALALGALQLAFEIAAQAAYWSLMPLWYHLPFLALLIPGNLLGAHLRGRRMSVQPNEITDGREARHTASSVPKSVSAETTTRPSPAARPRMTTSDSC